MHYNATHFARAVGCSRRTARRWLRRHCCRYPEAHVRMDEEQMTRAVALYREQPNERTAQFQRKRAVAPARRQVVPTRERPGLRARVLAAFEECGNATLAATRAGCRDRTARRWVRESQSSEVNRCQNA